MTPYQMLVEHSIQRKDIRINLGSGIRNFGINWDHIDGATHPHIMWHDVTKLPYADNTVSLIFSSHLVAYFDRNDIVPVFEEWFRVLKPGGILRIATPDFEALITLYKKERAELGQLLGPLYGRMKMNDEYVYHKTTWDFISLSKFLMGTGFTSYKKYDFRETEHAQFDDHSAAHIPHSDEAIKTRHFRGRKLISLNVECIKPL